MIFFLSLIFIFIILIIVLLCLLHKNTKRINDIIRRDSLENHIQQDHTWKKEFEKEYKMSKKKNNRILFIVTSIFLLIFVTSLILSIYFKVFISSDNEIYGLQVFILLTFIISIISLIVFAIIISIINSKPKEYEVNGYLLIRVIRINELIYFKTNEYETIQNSCSPFSFLGCEELIYIHGAIFPITLVDENKRNKLFK